MPKRIILTKEKIDEIFENSKSCVEYWSSLYQVAFINWNEVSKIEGYPQVSESTNLYLTQKAIEFDKIYHENYLAGGLWLQKGFGTGNLEEDWVIDISNVQIEMKN